MKRNAHRIKTWLRQQKRGRKVPQTQSQLAAAVGCTQGALSNIARGHSLPGDELADRLEEVTGGYIPAGGWR